MFNFGGRKTKNISDASTSTLVAPYSSFKPVTPASTDLPNGPCLGVWASADCTISGITSAGDTITNLPIFKGRNQISMSRISAVSAGNVWACS